MSVSEDGHNSCRASPAQNSITTATTNNPLANQSPGVCPKEEENDKSLESHVKIFESTNDELFDLFAADEDLSGRWVIHHDKIPSPNSTTPMNCTMAFLVNCVDMYKCESSCISMGASGYRWFHVGCCECVGKYCLNFGFNEIRCRNCPVDGDQVIDSAADNL